MKKGNQNTNTDSNNSLNTMQQQTVSTTNTYFQTLCQQHPDLFVQRDATGRVVAPFTKVIPAQGKARFSVNGNSIRLEWNHINPVTGEIRQWNEAEDLSLIDKTQGKAGLETIARMVAGQIVGNGKILIVAPPAKLTYRNGTGTYAYVFGDYENDFAIDVEIEGEAVKIPVIVEAKDLPRKGGVRKLYVGAGRLYTKSYEGEFTLDGDGAFIFWASLAARSMIEGYNVSVSLGPDLQRELPGLASVLGAPDIDAAAQANDTRRWAGRQTAAFNREVAQTQATMQIEQAHTGVKPSAAQSLMVPAVHNYGTPNAQATEVDMMTYPVGQTIRLAASMGRGYELTPHRPLATGTVTERMALATVIVDRSLAVILS